VGASNLQSSKWLQAANITVIHHCLAFPALLSTQEALNVRLEKVVGR
jgi:hypothetical protein